MGRLALELFLAKGYSDEATQPDHLPMALYECCHEINSGNSTTHNGVPAGKLAKEAIHKRTPQQAEQKTSSATLQPLWHKQRAWALARGKSASCLPAAARSGPSQHQLLGMPRAAAPAAVGQYSPNAVSTSV